MIMVKGPLLLLERQQNAFDTNQPAPAAVTMNARISAS
jgi:hypothetical protein